VLPLRPAQDFKRAGDGDTGPNTGGMGAYTPLPWAPPDLVAEVVDRVLQPTVDEMARRGTPFAGLLYAGLALTGRGVRVVEFNARFGDPETQVLMPRFEGDLLLALFAAAGGDLSGVQFGLRDDAAVTVVIAAPDYPARSDYAGAEIAGLAAAEATGALVFHGGTAVRDGAVVTNGGRILSVTATGETIGDARGRAYDAVKLISFDGAQYRRDIAHA
jgi:phosphoribosylamine--glycine ligase